MIGKLERKCMEWRLVVEGWRSEPFQKAGVNVRSCPGSTEVMRESPGTVALRDIRRMGEVMTAAWCSKASSWERVRSIFFFDKLFY